MRMEREQAEISPILVDALTKATKGLEIGGMILAVQTPVGVEVNVMAPRGASRMLILEGLLPHLWDAIDAELGRLADQLEGSLLN